MTTLLEWLAQDPENEVRFHSVIALVLVIGVIFVAELCFDQSNPPEDK
jgi:hypothetical protein